MALIGEATLVCEAIGEGFVILRTGDSKRALALVLLYQVMADFVHEHIEEHEVAEGLIRPSDGNARSPAPDPNDRSGAHQRFFVVFGQRSRYAPGRVRLIEKNDAPRDHKATEPEAAPRPRELSLDELDAAKSVGAFLAEEAEDTFDIRLVRWMMAALSGVLADDTREGSGDLSDGRRELGVNP